MFPLFVVLACLAVVSSDNYQTHRHSSHNPVCLTDMGLPARKIQVRTRPKEVDATACRSYCSDFARKKSVHPSRMK